jgi:hypothetical protein
MARMMAASVVSRRKSEIAVAPRSRSTIGLENWARRSVAASVRFLGTRRREA